jgi:hypothetical protein
LRTYAERPLGVDPELFLQVGSKFEQTDPCSQTGFRVCRIRSHSVSLGHVPILFVIDQLSNASGTPRNDYTADFLGHKNSLIFGLSPTCSMSKTHAM